MKYKTLKVIFSIVLFQICGYALFYSSGNLSTKTFALTYDDGPALITLRLLSLLKERKAPATFFLLGERIDTHPQIAKKIVDEGFDYGCHTYHHENFYALDKKGDVKKEILKNEIDLFEKAASRAGLAKTKLLRMPNGFSKQWARDIIFSKGYHLINWTFGADWQKMSEEKMIQAYISALKPGAIILLHDGGKNKEKTIRITKAILDEAEKKGLRPVSLYELLNIK